MALADDHVRTRLLQNLHDLRADYEAALKDFGESRLSPEVAKQLYDIWRELSRCDANDPPHKAVYVVARCTAQLEWVVDSYRAIEAHKEAFQKLEEYDRRRDIEHG